MLILITVSCGKSYCTFKAFAKFPKAVAAAFLDVFSVSWPRFAVKSLTASFALFIFSTVYGVIAPPVIKLLTYILRACLHVWIKHQ